MDIINKNINDCIKIMASTANISLAQLARDLGDSPQGLNQRMKLGKLQKDMDYLEKLAAACGFSFQWKFTEETSGTSTEDQESAENDLHITLL